MPYSSLISCETYFSLGRKFAILIITIVYHLQQTNRTANTTHLICFDNMLHDFVYRVLGIVCELSCSFNIFAHSIHKNAWFSVVGYGDFSQFWAKNESFCGKERHFSLRVGIEFRGNIQNVGILRITVAWRIDIRTCIVCVCEVKRMWGEWRKRQKHILAAVIKRNV